MSADLFGEPLIAGLDYRSHFISAEDERTLIARLSEMELSPFRFHGWTGKRKTRSFGWRYDFEDSSFTPAEPIPTWLQPLRARAAAFAAVDPGEIHHALIALYEPGAGIGWHRDRDVFDRVVGVSLNEPATLRFRQRAERGFRRFNLNVEPRSAYLLSGQARLEWEHRIVPGGGLRYSVTFRTLSAKGRLVAKP